MSEPKIAMDVASIKQSCRRLHMPTVAGQCVRLAEQAIKEKRSHLAFLEALLEAEVEEREKNVVARRLKDAHFPKIKTVNIPRQSRGPYGVSRSKRLLRGR